MLEREGLKTLEEALTVLEQGFASMAQQGILRHDLQQLLLMTDKPGSKLH